MPDWSHEAEDHVESSLLASLVSGDWVAATFAVRAVERWTYTGPLERAVGDRGLMLGGQRVRLASGQPGANLVGLRRVQPPSGSR